MKIIELIIEHPMISSESDLHMVNFHIYAEENVLGIEWRGLTSKHGDTWDYNIFMRIFSSSPTMGACKMEDLNKKYD